MPTSPRVSRRGSEGAVAGVTIIELLVALALLSIIAGFLIPAFGPLLRSRSLDAAAATFAGELARVRQEALARRCYVGIVFDRAGGEDAYAVYSDGGQRGIHASEVRSGDDPLVRGPFTFGARFPGVRLGIPGSSPIPKIPPSHGTLAPGSDPIQFGPSDIISFSPIGESSTGSLYMTDGRGGLRAVVLYGRTGRVRVWRYDADSRMWRQ